MEKNETGFSIEMPKTGIVRGVKTRDVNVKKSRVNLRIRPQPYTNVYSVEQLRTIQGVMEEYGDCKILLTPRHNLEIPEIKPKHIKDVAKKLYVAGLFPGGTGTLVRNIFTCPDWCSQSLRSTQEIGKMVSENFRDKIMPNKVAISFAGCPNACSRANNTDIGIIAVKETGFKILIGGKEGLDVAFGQVVADCVDTFEVLEVIEKVLTNYQKKAILRPFNSKKKERLAEVVGRIGVKSFMAD